jgi:hypothetical protein
MALLLVDARIMCTRVQYKVSKARHLVGNKSSRLNCGHQVLAWSA